MPRSLILGEGCNAVVFLIYHLLAGILLEITFAYQPFGYSKVLLQERQDKSLVLSPSAEDDQLNVFVLVSLGTHRFLTYLICFNLLQILGVFWYSNCSISGQLEPL